MRNSFQNRSTTKGGGLRRAIRRRNNPEAAPIPELEGEHPLSDMLLAQMPVQSFRESKYLHVSDLVYNCARKVALRYTHPIQDVPVSLMESMAITFKIGEAVHDYVIDKLRPTGRIYGRWRCQCGELEHIGVNDDQHTLGILCEVCTTGLDVYREIQLVDEEHMIMGSVDLMMQVPGGLHINELKSIAGKGWRDLQRPQPEHVFQVLFYWWLAKRMGMAVTDHPSILYVNKEYMFGNPYKEFRVDAPENLHRIEPLLEEAKIIKQAKEGGKVLPARVTCPTQNCPTAKSCEYSVTCFSEE